MTITRALHAIAGLFILGSLALSHFTGNTNWLWFAAFVGANLFQSAFTNWCMLAKILAKAGLSETDSRSC